MTIKWLQVLYIDSLMYVGFTSLRHVLDLLVLAMRGDI